MRDQAGARVPQLEEAALAAEVRFTRVLVGAQQRN
jgi:hypothetical protein